MNHNVVCCLTPAGASAIAVIGLRGPTVWAKISPYFTPTKKMPALTNTPEGALGKLQRDGLGDEIVLMLRGNAEHQEIELQLHGGPGIVAWCLAFAEELGCERIDWPQWRSEPLWKLLPLATTRKTAGMLLDQCQGAFDRAVAEITQSKAESKQKIAAVNELLSWSSLGTHLVQPWKIVLAGPPNVGKSSLFNALLGFERAITSPIPGTTRDLVTSTVVWDGYPLEFTDTAGLRDEGDRLETAGMQRTHSAAQEADMVLWLVDLNQDETALPKDIKPTITVGTKADLPRRAAFEPDYIVSASQGIGLSELLSAILKRLVPVEPKLGQGMPVLPAQIDQLIQLRASFIEQ